MAFGPRAKKAHLAISVKQFSEMVLTYKQVVATELHL